MTKFSSLALGVALLGLASCATDEPGNNGPGSSTNGDVYATLTLSLPSTRSTTDNVGDNGGETNSNATPDYEVGSDKENMVKGVYVLLARYDHDNNVWYYAGSSYQDNVMASGMAGHNVTYTLSFESSELASAIAASEGETINVNVFAYCNPSVALTTALNDLKAAAGTSGTYDLTEFFNSTETLTSEGGNGIWADNSFLMTNAKISDDVVIPDYATLVDKYGNVENPLHLGVVEVERVVSRFDFRNYILNDKNTGEPYPVNTYPIRIGTSDEIVAFVKLDAMSLVNMAKEFYYLPRVSNNGLNEGTSMTLCGVETPTNYVVSPNAALKMENKPSSLFENYFNPLYNGEMTVSPSTFTYTTFSSLTEDDNWEGPETYKIWRYCTENTIPGITTQKEGITTGIYFRGQIVASATAVFPENWTEETTQAQKLAWAMNTGKILYFFKEETNNVIYAGVKDLIEVAQANPTSKLHDAVVKAFGNIDSPDFNIDDVEDLSATTEGIGLYRPDASGKYNVYYFYKNRHNDNENNTEMGVMEFATVRNNVYKLYVSNIHKFGHPGRTPDDPDPEDPDDPDETENVYFDVQVHVLPWVVRVNPIEF